MVKNQKVKIVLGAVAVLLIVFQGLCIGVAAPKGYYLIYDWIFYGINYAIIILICIIYTKNRYVRWVQWIIGLLLLVANTTFFYYMGDVNVIVSKSPDNQHELILKEHQKMKTETVRLKRRGIIFGRKTATLTGSSKYKTIEEKTYKINWVSGDIAVVTYQASDNGTLQQNAFNYRKSDYISYQYVAPSLNGKWLEKGNPDNYFMYDMGEIVYAENGKLFYYNAEDTEQQGIFSLVIQVDQDQGKPSFSVVLNSDAEFDENGLIKVGGTISIVPMTLDDAESKVYYRES
ncbi:hypothetical protein [Virgibacillus oceani]|uniref:Uncharacterized protein n=1 Tax=Virgibacillus oceani TaxID=1479511 RepID=A0A917HNJ6_9BACI|nr:hypothetical protein [Virgibacillus oceani]GGG84475.1 hypothetical protein GCM10011398_32690 [Virgibacillus oceani]